MAQSHAKIYMHLIFSTKNREPRLDVDIRPKLWAYQAGILKNHNCPAVEIGGVEDHVHMLFCLSRTLSIARVVEEVKKSSTKWLKDQDQQYHDFHWQNGYGAFSVSASIVKQVRQYIRNQEQHHMKVSFQDELREFFRKHGVEWDEKYVWD